MDPVPVIEDTAPLWERRLRALPDDLQERLQLLRRKGHPLCEETLLMLWWREPERFGADAVALRQQRAGDAHDLHYRLTCALDACLRHHAPPWPPSPQLRDLLMHPDLQPQAPATLLSLLLGTAGSLLRRALGPAAAARWPVVPGAGPPREELRVGSGPYHGNVIPITQGRALALGRDGTPYGDAAGPSYALSDRSVPRFKPHTAPPLSLRLEPGALHLQIGRAEVRWQQDLWDRGPTLRGAQRLALAVGAQQLRVGSTLLRLWVPSDEERRPPLRIYLSHAAADQEHAEAACRHLDPLVQRGEVELWRRDRLPLGVPLQPQIARLVHESDVLLLLLSPDYHNDDDVAFEAQRARQLHEQGSAKVWPLLLRPVATTPLPPRMPREIGAAITQERDRDWAWSVVLRAVLRAHGVERS